MHTFLMIILERRRELALMRALGATRGTIRLLVLGEATLLGIVGGLAGILIGFVGTRVVDAVFHSQVGDFPFKPDSLFVVSPWMAAAAFGFALLFCWVGALLPAFRASAIDPAAALAGR
jgi:ABC-type antimicrobial peptide transport system permease subunit